MKLEEMYKSIFNNILKDTLEECYKEGLNKYLNRDGCGNFSILLGENPSIKVNIKFEDIEDKLLNLFMDMDNKNDDSYLDENKAKGIVKLYIKEYLNNLILVKRQNFKL